MKKLIGLLAVGFTIITISCQKDEVFVQSAVELNEKSAQILVSEISVDNAMADINFESDFFIGAEGMMMGFGGMQGGMNGGMHGGMGGTYGGNYGDMHGNAGNWNQGQGMRYMMGHGPQYSMHGNQGQYPDSLVMDYGMGTQLGNGRMLSGEMIIHNTGEPHENGFMREITYNNFSVDSMMVSGKTTMEITGDETSGRTHTMMEDIWLTFPDGTTVHRQSEIVRTWVEGESTPLVQTDDMMQVTGHVTNTLNENGVETVYRKEIIEPLIKSSFCRYFSSGIIEISIDGTLSATLDYGNGECDNVAHLLKVGEETVEIALSDYDHCSNSQGNGYVGNDNHYNGQGTGMGQGTSGGHGNGSGHGHGGGRG